MKRTSILLTVAAAAVAASTLGVVAKERGGPDFSTLDLDGNGELTQTELQNAAQARFDAADTDGNGALSQAELEARGSERAKTRAARMIEHLDANEDGELSREEMSEGRKGGRRGGRDLGRMFERIDADGSGTITQAEFDEARENFRGKRGKRGDKPAAD